MIPFPDSKIFFIYECPIKKLLPLGLLLHLHNLVEIHVENCLEIEEIIAEACDEFEEDEEEKEEKGMDTAKITLPKLRYLTLSILPELKTICSSSKVIVCDSPPRLKEIEAYDKGWWESLEWVSPDARNVLQPFFLTYSYFPGSYYAFNRYLHSSLLNLAIYLLRKLIQLVAYLIFFLFFFLLYTLLITQRVILLSTSNIQVSSLLNLAIYLLRKLIQLVAYLFFFFFSFYMPF